MKIFCLHNLCGNHPGVLIHIAEIILLCLDTESMEMNDKDKFLGVFYEFFMVWLLEPIARYGWMGRCTYCMYVCMYVFHHG